MSSEHPAAWSGPGTIPAHDTPVPPGFTTTALFDPFELHCGPFFDRGAPGPRHQAFRVDERHVNLQGICHGGMLLTFADSAMGLAAWDATDRAPCVTVSMQATFVRPARHGELVEVTPEIVRRTRELIFLRGDFKVGGELIATVTSVWKLLAPAA